MEDCPPMMFHVQASTSSKHEMCKADLKQLVAIAVINRLHEWCVQLFWITIFCVMGACGEESLTKGSKPTSSRHHHKSTRKNLAEIEMQVLRHLTSPQLTRVRPVSRKRRPASRPPSPQLFDIQEESEC